MTFSAYVDRHADKKQCSTHTWMSILPGNSATNVGFNNKKVQPTRKLPIQT